MEAATGKEGSAANRLASIVGNAGDVLSDYMKNYPEVVFDRDCNLSKHFEQIARLPDSCWSDAVAYLLKEVARLSVRA